MGVLCDFRKIIYVKKHFSSGYKNLFPIAIFFLLLMFTTRPTRTNLTLLWSRMNQRHIYSNPRKQQGTLLSFFTNPIVKKSKADTKVKKPYDRNDTRKFKNEWFKQFE